jgi:small subunit ribosomal protein S4
MPIRKHKKFSRPKKLFNSARIKEENLLVKEYGLKSKREIWKADSAIDNTRKQAKLFLTKSEKEQEKFIERLKRQGFAVGSIADALALDKKDYLKRRLQSIIVEKKLATTPRQARQFIIHKHITINKNVINIPSYLVPVDEEDKIELTIVRKEKKKEDKIEKVMEAPKEPEEGEDGQEGELEEEGENAND